MRETMRETIDRILRVNDMTRNETIMEFCAIGGVVREHFGNEYPADCLCPGVPDNPCFDYSPRVTDFVWQAVLEKIAREVTPC